MALLLPFMGSDRDTIYIRPEHIAMVSECWGSIVEEGGVPCVPRHRGTKVTLTSGTQIWVTAGIAYVRDALEAVCNWEDTIRDR